MQNHREKSLFDWLNQSTSFKVQKLYPVSGDASFRRYFRFICNGKPYIAVDAPVEHEDSHMFIQVQKMLCAQSIKVPTIFNFNLIEGFLCVEDFGDTLLIDKLLSDNNHFWYQQALSIIPSIQAMNTEDRLPYYDKKMIMTELKLFDQWFLKQFFQVTLTPSDMSMLEKTYSYVCHVFTEQPQCPIHRDFHSKNLMVINNEQLGVIDFQGAVIGPITYDAVSLLTDCYISCSTSQIESLLYEWYCKNWSHFPWQKFRYWFDMTALQRLIKVAGIFSRLSIRDNKRNYLQYIPAVVDKISKICHQYDELNAFNIYISATVIPLLEKHYDQ